MLEEPAPPRARRMAKRNIQTMSQRRPAVANRRDSAERAQGEGAEGAPVKFLLDTNVISQPFAPKPDSGCLRWLDEQTEHEVATTCLTVAELWQGIFNLAASDNRRGPLTTFVNELPDSMRVLGFDQRAARKWGEITRRGLDPLPVRDSLIAAIAISRNLTVVTRDLGPFKRASCRTLNPFAS